MALKNRIQAYSVASKLLCDRLLKITRLNLTTESMEELKVDSNFISCDEDMIFTDWVATLLHSEYIPTDDKEIFAKNMDVAFLRRHFKTNDYHSFRYRQTVKKDFHFVCIQIIKGREYHRNYEVVYVYVNDINEIQTKEFELIKKLKDVTLEAERANQGKSEFLSRMSHDIRNPLNVISGLNNLCRQNLDDKEMLEDYLTKIANSTKYLLTLINDTLDVSRIESKKLYLKFTDFNIEDMLLEVRDNFNTTDEEHTLRTDIEIDHKIVMADYVRLQQIINNILSNSFKYTVGDDKTVFLKLREKGIDETTSIYILEIEDHGMGMDDEVLAKLFKPFERGIDSRINQIQGTGLGMAIVKNLVELMNGQVHVSSTVGVGTKFTVEIPCKHSKQFFRNGYDVKDISILQGKDVLVAEDYPINQMILEEFLKVSGVRCDFANNGQEAVEKFIGKKYDAILMDIQMPNMDGYEATKKIRNVNKRIPIIAISADAFNEDVAKMVECGMNDHVSKPIEQNKLLSVLTKYL